MPCFIYASVCSACTTSSRGERRGFYETEMVLDYSSSNYRDSAISLRWRRSCDASVELAAAAAIRLADADILAGAWTAGALPDSFRRTRPSWRTRRETPLGWPLQTNDARRAREIPAGNAGGIRFCRTREPERRKLDAVQHRMSS